MSHCDPQEPFDLNGFSRFARERIDLDNTLLDEHDERLKDLERGARSE